MDKQFIFSNTLSESDRDEIRRLQGPVLVVGASGFIGANLFFALAAIRDDVYATIRGYECGWRLLQWERASGRKCFVQMDITSPRSVADCIGRLRPGTVFNLSAYGAYARQDDAERIHVVNYMGVFNLMSRLSESGCAAFVQAGSSSEYGLNCRAPTEDGKLDPNSDYAVSKGAVSLLISYFGKIKAFSCVNLRLYSVYGPWEERDRLISRLLTCGLRGEYPPLVDSDISRDFVYIDDCISAFVKAALTICVTDPGISVNIASGIKTSLADVANEAKELFKISTEPIFGRMPNRRWDLANWYGTARLADLKMDWRTRVSFREGLRLSMEWERAAQSLVAFSTVPKNTKKISAIIACYRDEQAIPVMYERITKMFATLEVDYEVIFVNDNSPVADEERIRELCAKDPRVIGVSHSRNFGSQSAFLSGMEIASGDAVVLMDGDLQDPPEIIPAFVEKWKAGFEVVYGVRVKREAPWYMQIAYKVFYRVFRALSEFSIPVDAGDFSLIDRRVIEQMLRFSEKDVFLRGLRAWVGFRQIGVPYVRPERMFGTTTNNFMKNVWWAKKALFSFSVKPLEYIQRFAVILFLASFLLAAFYFIHYLINPPAGAKGVTTIVLLVLGLGGVQLFSLSILGDYIGKVLEEVKNRPRFIRSRIFSAGDVYETREALDTYLSERGKTYGKYC